MTPQSVLDALADAETLRLFARDAKEAKVFVLTFVDAGHAVRKYGRRGWHVRAFESARQHARAAFRAVPALRGEE